jgi:hypothetical protein
MVVADFQKPATGILRFTAEAVYFALRVQRGDAPLVM